MFGYVVVNQPELKMKDYETYRRYYCGLCTSLRDGYGVMGQVSLSFDMTFLVVLLSALYEPENDVGSRRCAAHPLERHAYIQNKYADYVADMNVILSYYKCMDDWEDERKVSRKLYARLLLAGKKGRRLRENYPHKVKVIAENLKAIRSLEKQNTDDMDALSGHFGRIMAEVCAPDRDEWESYLRKMGYYLGKFVYIMDAYDDIEKDLKSGNFNPFVIRLAKKLGVDVQSMDESLIDRDTWAELGDWTKDVLMMMAASMAKEYEMLPIVENVDILRNIIYSGIWEAYYRVTDRRCGSTDKKESDKDKV